MSGAAVVVEVVVVVVVLAAVVVDVVVVVVVVLAAVVVDVVVVVVVGEAVVVDVVVVVVVPPVGSMERSPNTYWSFDVAMKVDPPEVYVLKKPIPSKFSASTTESNVCASMFCVYSPKDSWFESLY